VNPARPKRQEQFMDKGTRLAQLRGPKPQREIAEQIGVKPQAVSNWERGINAVDPEHLAALDAALNAGGEVIALYSPDYVGGVTLADIDAKLDGLRDGQVQMLADLRNEIAQATEAAERATMALIHQLESMRQSRRSDGRAAEPRR
jgi:transcriptional regulator with XRE-family HTH domain